MGGSGGGGGRGSGPPLLCHDVGFLTLGPKLDPPPFFFACRPKMDPPLFRNRGSAPAMNTENKGPCYTILSCTHSAGHNLPDKSCVADTAMQIELA